MFENISLFGGGFSGSSGASNGRNESGGNVLDFGGAESQTDKLIKYGLIAAALWFAIKAVK